MTFPKRQSNKYGARSSKCYRGHNHASALESAVCNLLWAREQAGEIKLLAVEDDLRLGPMRHPYRADFKFLDIKTGRECWAEAKGQPDRRWASTKRIWKHYGFGPLEIYRGTWKRPMLEKIIVPEQDTARRVWIHKRDNDAFQCLFTDPGDAVRDNYWEFVEAERKRK